MPRKDLSKLLRRTVGFRAVDKESRTVTVRLSSENPVDRWGDQEILLHGSANIRMDRLRDVGAFHLYHDYTKPVAAIVSVKIVDKELEVALKFGRTQIAEEAWKDVEDGILRGVSVGYNVHAWEFDEDTREARATDWEPFEGSFTTIPADPTVGVDRDADELVTAWRDLLRTPAPAPKPKPPTPAKPRTPPTRNSTVKITAAVLMSLCRAFQLHAKAITRMADKGKTEAQIRSWLKLRTNDSGVDEDKRDEDEEKDKEDDETETDESDDEREDDETDDGDESERASQIAGLRAENAILKRCERLRNLAAQHGIELGDMNLRKFRSEAEGIRALLARKANDGHTPSQSTGGRLTVGADGTDKRRAAVIDALVHRHFGSRDVAILGDDAPKKDLGMRRHALHEMMRSMIVGGEKLTRDQVQQFCTRQNIHELNLRDANQSAANFATVLGNFADKAVLIGYNNQVLTHTEWTSERLVDDFKDVYGAAIQTGLLAEQEAKGAPASEMNLLEKSYNGSLGLFMRTLMITYQDWRNDDLGLFADAVRMAGAIGATTEEWQVYKTLLALTWTDYKTNAAAFWDDTNDRLKYTGLGNTMAGLHTRKATVNAESIQLNPVAGVLLVPTKREAAAFAAIGQTTSNLLPQVVMPRRELRVVSSSWLSNASLSGYNDDDYYVIAKNMDTVKVLRDRQNPRPTVRTIDAGATPDFKFLIMHAFRPVVASQDGMQQGDWA